LTLTGAAVAGGSSGSAAWFEPTTPIASLSFLFTQQSGTPAYQTWFASLAHDITGTVSKDDGSLLPGVTLSLYSPNGELTTTTQTGPAGTYAFQRVQASAGYTVRVTPPAGLAPVGPDGQLVDVSTGDDAADFVLRDIVPFEVSGRVVDQHGNGVPGVQVDVDSPAGTVTTDADGVFRADNVSPGQHTATLKALPVGYYSGDAVNFPTTLRYDVLNSPVTGLDFTIFKLATLGGVVSAGARGVPGATITATGADNTQATTVTGADGSYALGLEPDDYTVTVSPPPGHFVLGSDTRHEVLKESDVSDADFALGAFGTASGTVTDTTARPVSALTVTLSGPGGVTPVSTDAAGGFAFGGLRAGTYEIMLTVPGDRHAIGTTTRTITITDAGETITGQDFVVSAIAPLDPVTPVPAQTGGSGTLPATGSDSVTPLLTMALLLVAGLIATAAAAVARRHRKRRS
jgi:LPXTG-motif cell wall-anchored protein